MASPFSVAALTTFPHGPGQSPDALTSLANSAAKGLGSLGATLTEYVDDNVAPIKIKTGAASVSASGTVLVYVVTSEDGSNWTNGIDPTSTSDQSSKLTGLTPLSPVLNANANATTYFFPEFSIYSILGFMPSYWSVVILNQTGAAFDATASNFTAKHSLVSYA